MPPMPPLGYECLLTSSSPFRRFDVGGGFRLSRVSPYMSPAPFLFFADSMSPWRPVNITMADFLVSRRDCLLIAEHKVKSPPCHDDPLRFDFLFSFFPFLQVQLYKALVAYLPSSPTSRDFIFGLYANFFVTPVFLAAMTSPRASSPKL